MPSGTQQQGRWSNDTAAEKPLLDKWTPSSTYLLLMMIKSQTCHLKLILASTSSSYPHNAELPCCQNLLMESYCAGSSNMRAPGPRARTTVVLAIAFILERLDESLLGAVYTPMGKALHASPSQLGTLTLCRALVQAGFHLS